MKSRMLVIARFLCQYSRCRSVSCMAGSSSGTTNRCRSGSASDPAFVLCSAGAPGRDWPKCGEYSPPFRERKRPPGGESTRRPGPAPAVASVQRRGLEAGLAFELARDVGLERGQVIENRLRFARSPELVLDARELVPAVRTHRLQRRVALERRDRFLGVPGRDERKREAVESAVVVRVDRERRAEGGDRARVVVALLQQEAAVEVRFRVRGGD